MKRRRVAMTGPPDLMIAGWFIEQTARGWRRVLILSDGSEQPLYVHKEKKDCFLYKKP